MKKKSADKLSVWENLGDIDLSEILTWLLQSCGVDTLLFTSRKGFGASGKGRYRSGIDPAARKILGNKLIACFEAKGWPGTELIGHKGRVYVSEFDPQLAAKMAKIQGSFFKWLHEGPKPLPEDLCLFKRGAKVPALISITHDRDAWVIAETCPPGFTISSLSPEELYIWSGEYFCQI